MSAKPEAKGPHNRLEVTHVIRAALAEPTNVNFYRYAESQTSRWLGFLFAASGFAFACFMLWRVLSTGPSVLNILFGTLGLAWGLLWLLACIHTNPRHFEISTLGITSFDDRGEIVALWDEITKVEKFKSRIDRKPRLHFRTSAGDFIVFGNLYQFDRLLEEIRLHIPDRIFEGKDKSWIWRATCSKCGGEFSGNACRYCERSINRPDQT